MNKIFTRLLMVVMSLGIITSVAYAGRNGSGTYTAPSNSWNPAISGQSAAASDWNDTLDDLETALSGSLSVDGQTIPTANLPMGTYKHTGVGDASARTQYTSAKQYQDGDLLELTSVSGADTITATAPLSLSAYAAGQTFRFVATDTNTTAVTLNLNGAGAKAIQKLGVALVAGDITSGDAVEVFYDGTQFQMLTPARTPVLTAASITATELAANSVGTSEIINSNVTKAKIENLTDYTVLGNVSGGAAAPAEVPILDEDNLTSNSAVSLATQQSIKAYVDAAIGAIPTTGQAKFAVKFNIAGTVQGTALNVSSVTRNSDGKWTVNFSSSFSNVNYVVVASGHDTSGTASKRAVEVVSQSTSSVQVLSFNTETATVQEANLEFIHVVGF